jgi:2-C-methyl-D-erythritol 4-phosphate cytidylyltransferase
MAKFAVILPAAGKSRRFQDKNYKKPFAPLANRAVWLHSAERFMNRPDVSQTILVLAAEDRDWFYLKFSANVAILGIEVVDGGAERADSVERALAVVRDDVDFVAVHDAARPCLADPWIDEIFTAAEKHGAAIPATPMSATLKRAGDGQRVVETVDRTSLWAAQTPQVFRRQWLVDAYAQRGDFNATDDAQLVERLGKPVTIVLGSSLNLKITSREDLKLAELILKILPKPQGSGFSHPFADDDLWK